MRVLAYTHACISACGPEGTREHVQLCEEELELAICKESCFLSKLVTEEQGVLYSSEFLGT